MATSQLNEFLDNVDEKVLECTICFKRLRNPKSLNCFHSFCFACLEDWVKTKGKLTCPTCSKSYPIPEGGLQKLPPNTFLNNLLETIEQFSLKDQIKCACKKGEAKYYCQDCRQYLCSICMKNHEDFRLFANHKVHSVEDVQAMSPPQMTLLHPPQCLHHDKPLEFYCTECKTPICMHCTITDHSAWEGNHKPISISKAFKKFRENSETLEKAANDYKSTLQDSLKTVIQNSAKIGQIKDTTMKDIDNHVQELVRKIKENGEKIKHEVLTIYKKKKKANDLQMGELEATISDINTKLTFLNQLLKSDEATAMHSSERVITALKDRINELPNTEPVDGYIKFFKNKQLTSSQQFYIGYITQLRAADSLTLKGEESVTEGQIIIVKIVKTNECEIDANQLKATWTQPTGESNITQVEEDDNGDYFVKVKCTSPGVCKLDMSADDEPIKQSPKMIKVEKKGLVNTIQIQKSVKDVVKCEDDCLLVSCWTNEMFKYKQSGEYIGKVTLPQEVKVVRMCTLKNGNIAFSDSSNKCIILCDMNGNVIKSIGEKIFTYSTGIHMNETSKVVYAADYHKGCVFMFDIDSGNMIKMIGSKGNQEGQMSGLTDVTVYHGDVLVLEHDNSRLQLFDNEGRFIKVLIKAGDGNGRLRNPRGVVVDEDDNIIISSEHKLQLFSSDGSFIKRIDKPQDGIKYPQGLSIIPYHPRKLAVANQGDNTVKIFNY